MKQEIFAHFNLIAMTRLFTNFGDAMHNSQSPPDPLPESQANFKAALFAVARNLEGLILRHAAMMHNAVHQVLACVGNRKAAPASKSILSTTLPKTPRQMAEGTRLRSCSLSARATVPPNTGLAELRFLKRMPKFP